MSMKERHIHADPIGATPAHMRVTTALPREKRMRTWRPCARHVGTASNLRRRLRNKPPLACGVAGSSGEGTGGGMRG
ncbi:hypothetical protein E2562_038335 [Oryza meyeriana var. granulata]|uniref:Uncharacterized protein n=1 Tax=Oryza meyeriana var. granulata TaxID=110450 RepID=A0A6G1CM16_9ORYZ|nr:hypothetical protein E2562_038335 [Oryza meyeriana var. granulata]